MLLFKWVTGGHHNKDEQYLHVTKNQQVMISSTSAPEGYNNSFVQHLAQSGQ